MPDQGEIVLPLFIDDQWRMCHRRGRAFDVDGRIIELFPVRVLAEAIGRTPQSIKIWEKEKKFPAPMFKVPAENGNPNRWYSKTQIANIRACYKKVPSQRELNRFLKLAWEVFYKLELTEDAMKGDVA